MLALVVRQQNTNLTAGHSRNSVIRESLANRELHSHCPIQQWPPTEREGAGACVGQRDYGGVSISPLHKHTHTHTHTDHTVDFEAFVPPQIHGVIRRPVCKSQQRPEASRVIDFGDPFEAARWRSEALFPLNSRVLRDQMRTT